MIKKNSGHEGQWRCRDSNGEWLRKIVAVRKASGSVAV